MRSLFIILCFAVQCCVAQKQDTLKKYLDENLTFTSRSQKVFTAQVYPENGHWAITVRNSKNNIVLIAYFSDKKLTHKDGPFVVYYSAGGKAAEGYYTQNQRTGVWRSWYLNGQLKDSGTINNDYLSGMWQNWYENGTLMGRGEYVSDSGNTASETSEHTSKSLLDLQLPAAIRHGVFQSWYNNAHPKDSGNYVRNQKNGLWKSWFENGRLSAAGIYKNNSLQGEWTFYREDGSMSTTEVYTDSLLTGLKCFDEKGNFTGSTCSVAKPPVLLGSRYDWKAFIENTLYWSKETLQNSTFGTVDLSLTIGKDGSLVGYAITKSPHELVSKDVAKVLEQMKSWSPAILHNRAIEFTLEHVIIYNPN